MREIEGGPAFLPAEEIGAAIAQLPDAEGHPTDAAEVWIDSARLGRVLLTFRRMTYRRHKVVRQFWTIATVARLDADPGVSLDPCPRS